MKNFLLVFGLSLVGASFIVITPVFAAMEWRNQTPLQPLPENTFPNYSNNVQSGTYLEESRQRQAADEAAQAELEKEQESDVVVGEPVLVGVSDNNLSTYLSILVVILSVGIAGAYYWYKTHKAKV